MRGNECECRLEASRKQDREFPIPMRGNEQMQVAAGNSNGFGVSIPMRGNEFLNDLQEAAEAAAVSDPHEG